MNILVADDTILPTVLEQFKDHNVISKVFTPVQKIVYEKLLYKTTVRVFNKLTERSLRGQSVDKIYTTPDSFIKYQTLLCVFYMDNPSLQIILLGK